MLYCILFIAGIIYCAYLVKHGKTGIDNDYGYFYDDFSD